MPVFLGILPSYGMQLVARTRQCFNVDIGGEGPREFLPSVFVELSSTLFTRIITSMGLLLLLLVPQQAKSD